jgi:hypothetical protein
VYPSDFRNIGFGELRVPALSPSCVALLSKHVGVVFSLRAKEKMLRVHAHWNVAAVQHM